MFTKLHKKVNAVLGNRFSVSEIAKEEEYFVFGIFGGKEDYLIVLLDGDTVEISNGDGRIKQKYNINDENLADVIIKTICELNCILL